MIAPTQMHLHAWAKRLAVTLLLCLMPLSGANAGPFEDGTAAYEKGDFLTARQLWLPLAEQGNVLAQANLGTLYFYGQGVPKNLSEYVNWCKKAAVQGDRQSQYHLGVAYEYGQGVGQDHAEAASWYLKAADQDHTASQNNLGILYEAGKGVKKNKVLALKWYAIAAQRGYTSADSATTLAAVKNKASLKAELTSSEIASAENMARLWRPMSGMSQQ
ncbi:MAG: sel1 repeat family protein [Alphaproteobacteria bacterium]|nr:sel1 repeat family protein [Alphaproteobacteria bacterium]